MKCVLHALPLLIDVSFPHEFNPASKIFDKITMGLELFPSPYQMNERTYIISPLTPNLDGRYTC